MRKLVLAMVLCGFGGSAYSAIEEGEGPTYSQRLRRAAVRISTAAAYTVPVAAGLYALESIPGADAGPITAVVCGVACEFIGIAGCSAGSALLLPLGPGVSLIYGSLCAAIHTGGAAATCVTTCLALPSP